ncbi:hypothetical protein CO172_02010 [Candidatus Uhrbacteria bacterium CG_4_9_14_3_um_filter_36_7]|uniref:DUF5320 domain-containing protein n=1 Tax=Candidatus Uhrbacteria bacterium CG_4_9_14_3_um_filter_36_7 TaxID=1975033 RepID=A0A2M7XHI2_9BACT|nr:MAG: hypothetical protein CO172_02010 [Candidatus Uhrbacteria bacterium CG_4_9_14_3_um_filter_36_7]
MPNLNGTGPQGLGPNGQRMGVCGMRKFCKFWSNGLDKNQEKKILKQNLQDIKNRLEELEEIQTK